MNANRSRHCIQTDFASFPLSSPLAWAHGIVCLSLVGCVASSTYEEARLQTKQQYGELSRVQVEIQGLEHERDSLHTTNRQDEQSLANLRAELKKIQASYEQIQKTNRDKLAALQQSIAGLRARHQAMIREIRETKHQEDRLKSVTSTYEKVMGKISERPQPTWTEGQAEQKLVAVVTPQTAPVDAAARLSNPPAPAQTAELPSPPVAAVNAPPVASVAAPPASQSSSTSEPAKASSPATHAIPQAPPQEQSWLASLTSWFSSLLDWIWA